MAGAYRGRPRDERAFQERVERALARVNLSDVVGPYTSFKRAGRELVGICMFHKERTPSLRVNDAKGTYHCFGCGKSGDAITFLVDHLGMTWMEAFASIEGDSYPEVDPAQRARAAAEDEAARQAAIAEARRVWEGASESRGTPAEVYLRSRGITMPLPPSIRFGQVYAWKDKDTGELGPDLPALIGGVTNGADEIVAVQRIFLRDGGRAKAKMKKPKLSLGRVKGGALKLDGILPNRSEIPEIIITEGPEDGLSLAQELPDRRVWVALGTAMMPEIEYPPEARKIVIAGQNDDAGAAAVQAAAGRLIDFGYTVKSIFPATQFKDWNDQLRGIVR